VSRLVAMGNVDDKLLTQFLAGRGAMPGETVAAVNAWIAEDIVNRWIIAGELEWPEPIASDLALRVRALAAARAVADTNAFGGLVAAAAARWLGDASDLPWADAARAALTSARLRLEAGLHGLSLPDA
jgi:hypothetical protein